MNLFRRRNILALTTVAALAAVYVAYNQTETETGHVNQTENPEQYAMAAWNSCTQIASSVCTQTADGVSALCESLQSVSLGTDTLKTYFASLLEGPKPEDEHFIGAACRFAATVCKDTVAAVRDNAGTCQQPVV